MSYLKKLSKFIIKDTVILLAIVLIFDFLIRILAPGVYHHQIFDNQFTGGFPIQANHLGTRGSEQHLKATKNSILVLGDSVTFGTGVSSKNLFTEKLSTALNRPVINAGYPGTGIQQLMHYYQTTWSEYESDTVVLVYTNQLLSRTYFCQKHGIKEHNNPYLVDESTLNSLSKFKLQTLRFIKTHLGLPSFLVRWSDIALYQIGLRSHEINKDTPLGVLLAYGYQQEDIPKAIIDTAYESIMTHLKVFKKELDQENKKLILVYVPTQFELNSNFKANLKNIPTQRFTIDPEEELHVITTALGIKFLSANTLLREQANTAYIPFDYSHLSKAGHHILAKLLSSAIEPSY